MHRHRNTPSRLHRGTVRGLCSRAQGLRSQAAPPSRAWSELPGRSPCPCAHYPATEGFPVQHAGILPAVISARAVGSLRGVLTFIVAAAWLAIVSGANAQNAVGAVSPGEAPAQAPATLKDLSGLSGPHRPRIGLVLSGGGARGAAHIGVLKVLEELR